MTEARPRRWPLWLLLAAVVLPLTTAVGLHLGGWRPSATASHGELIRPPRALGDAALRTAGGTDFPAAGLRGKWTLIYAAPGLCAEECVRSLYGMRMAHVGQTKEYARVRRVVLVGEAREAAGLAANDPDLLILVAAGGQAAVLLGEPAGSRVWLSDPMGNLVLRFDAALDPAGMQKDLTRLIRHSWVG